MEQHLIYTFLIAGFSILFLIFIILEHIAFWKKCNKKHHKNINKSCPKGCLPPQDSYGNCETIPNGRKLCPWDCPNPQIGGKGCQYDNDCEDCRPWKMF